MSLTTYISASLFIFFSALMLKNKTSYTQQADLYETKWMLKKIHNENAVEEIDSKAFIKFNKEKKSAGGNGGCNSFGSTLKTSGNQINLSGIFSTKMYCEGIQPSEDAYLNALENVTRYEIKEGKLLLYDEDNLLLEFTGE